MPFFISHFLYHKHNLILKLSFVPFVSIVRLLSCFLIQKRFQFFNHF